MSQDQQLIGAVGLIRVAGLEITITPLSEAEELALDRELRRAAEAAAGDHYTRCKPELDAMQKAGATGDRIEFLRELARMSARREPLSDAAMFDFRNSPAGLVIELHARGRKATPGLERAALAAVITAAVADDVAIALMDLIRGGPDKKSRPADGGALGE